MRDRNNKTPFDTALENGKRDIACLLADHEGNLGQLSTSLEEESEESLADLSGSDSPDVEECTSESLLSASTNGRMGVVRRLLSRGADPNERSKNFKTPLDVASRNGRLEIARLLIKQGADVNSRDVFGWTPLHTAVAWGHINVAQLLLDHGADVNAKQRNYQTPLHLASTNDHLEIARLLLERGANIESRNPYGRTPSEEALMRGLRRFTQLVSEYGMGRA